MRGMCACRRDSNIWLPGTPRMYENYSVPKDGTRIYFCLGTKDIHCPGSCDVTIDVRVTKYYFVSLWDYVRNDGQQRTMMTSHGKRRFIILQANMSLRWEGHAEHHEEGVSKVLEDYDTSMNWTEELLSRFAPKELGTGAISDLCSLQFSLV